MLKEALQYIGEVCQHDLNSQAPETIIECQVTLVQGHSDTQAEEHGEDFQTIKRPASTDSKAQESPWHAISAVRKAETGQSGHG